jgi:hypothetical protein
MALFAAGSITQHTERTHVDDTAHSTCVYLLRRSGVKKTVQKGIDVHDHAFLSNTCTRRTSR